MFAPISPMLAQVASSARSIFVYLSLIVALAVVLVAVALWVRRRMLGDDEPGESFTLSDLRQLHASGELSDAEFDAARRKMIAQHRAMLLPGETDGETGEGRPDKDEDGAASGGR